MRIEQKIEEAQKLLQQYGIDGWLLYDFRRNNTLAHDFLEIPPDRIMTRRFFYWIPAKGVPVQILNEMEPFSLKHMPGEKRMYLRWQVLEETLKDILKGSKKVAMEYSRAVPYVSRVDGGTVDLIRSCGVEVVSSALLLQAYTSVLNECQVRFLYEAELVLKLAIKESWSLIRNALKENKTVTDCDVQRKIQEIFEAQQCTAYSEPFCAINADSANPHHMMDRQKPIPIKKGDLILIDLWCKKKAQSAIYADATVMGIAGKEATPKQKEIFALVRKAQKAATDLVFKRFEEGKELKGYEVDEVGRKVIEDAGYGKYFIHRIGHNIMTELHGPGTHFDSLETFDDRPVLKGSVSSCEPGIYLPGEFGVRLEYDLFVDHRGKVHIICDPQDDYVYLID